MANYVKYPLFNKTLEIIEIFQGIKANSFYFLFILCAWVFASIYVCKPHVCLVHQRLKNESDPLDHDTVVGWVLKSFLQPHNFHIRRIISGKKGGAFKGNLNQSKIYWDRTAYLWHRDELQFISEANLLPELSTSCGDQSFLLRPSNDSIWPMYNTDGHLSCPRFIDIYFNVILKYLSRNMETNAWPNIWKLPSSRFKGHMTHYTK